MSLLMGEQQQVVVIKLVGIVPEQQPLQQKSEKV
jgi:hypothetical protein